MIAMRGIERDEVGIAYDSIATSDRAGGIRELVAYVSMWEGSGDDSEVWMDAIETLLVRVGAPLPRYQVYELMDSVRYQAEEQAEEVEK